MCEKENKKSKFPGLTENADGLRRLFSFVMSAFTACALCMYFPAPWGTNFNGVAEEIVGNLASSFYGTAFMSTLLTLCLYCLASKVSGDKLRGNWAAVLLAALTAIIWLMGACFSSGGDLSIICSSPGQMLKSAIYYLGAAWLIYILLRGFCLALDSGWDMELKLQGADRLNAFLSRHRFGAVALLLLLCWSVPLAVCYPAAFCTDAWAQLAQYWGTEQFSSNHPPVHTLIMGSFSRLGMALGSANLGLFLFALLQTLAFALVIAYVFCLYEKLNAPRWIRLISLLMAVFSPFIANRAGILLKDAPYSIAFLLLMAQFIYALLDLDAFLKSKRQMLVTVVAVLGVMLMRNNGRYVLFPTALLLVFLLVAKRKSLGKSKTVKLLLLTLLPLTAAVIMNCAVVKCYNIASGSIAETLSLPFQQTARYVRDHGQEVTEEEREAIAAVLPYDRLAELYRPIISDPVKEEFNEQAGSTELKAYLRMWLQMFFKHPMTYVSATVNQLYALVYPFAENSTVYVGANDGAWFLPDVVAATGISMPASLDTERNVLTQWFLLMYSSPVIGMISHTAPYTIAACFLSIMAAVRKKYSFLLPAFPVLIGAVGLVFAPAIIANPRYAFPIVYSMPLLTGYFVYICRGGAEENCSSKSSALDPNCKNAC